MNKVFSYFTCIVVLLMAACFAQPVKAQDSPVLDLGKEQITDFSSAITIGTDSHLSVAETITYDFGSQEGKHGIYRDIPYRYSRNGYPYALRMKVVSVTDPDTNASYTWVDSKVGDNIEIKIGDANVTVSGTKKYKIQYEVDRAMNFFSDHDELYWNVTGDQWQVPIKNAKATITVPTTFGMVLSTACYTGAYGSAETNCTTAKPVDVDATQSQLIFSAKDLKSQEGLSIVVGLKAGTIEKPSQSLRAKWFLSDNWILFLPLLAFIFLHLYWMRKGRDPKVRQAVIPEYEPPDNLRPGELGTVWDEDVDMKDISATIIDFAVRGFMKIKALEKKNYRFTKLPKDTSEMSAYEKKIWTSIFLGNDSLQEVDLDSLKNKFYKDLPDIKNAMYDACIARNYFDSNPNTVKNAFRVMGGISLFGSFFLAGILQNVLTIPIFIIITLLFAIYGQLMPKRTVLGVQVKIHISGFKWFLSVTETERLKFHNAPEKKPELFEHFLPFAMALGVEKEWAGQFADIYKQPPSWYDGSSSGVFNALVFANVMSSMNSHMNSTMVSRPSSAGAGHSGFGGGGFSGGGFGGGGGGSW